jgi:hypothetical protein
LPDTRYREEGGDIEFLSLVKLQKKKGGIAPPLDNRISDAPSIWHGKNDDDACIGQHSQKD